MASTPRGTRGRGGDAQKLIRCAAAQHILPSLRGSSFRWSKTWGPPLVRTKCIVSVAVSIPKTVQLIHPQAGMHNAWAVIRINKSLDGETSQIQNEHVAAKVIQGD